MKFNFIWTALIMEALWHIVRCGWLKNSKTLQRRHWWRTTVQQMMTYLEASVWLWEVSDVIWTLPRSKSFHQLDGSGGGHWPKRYLPYVGMLCYINSEELPEHSGNRVGNSFIEWLRIVVFISHLIYIWEMSKYWRKLNGVNWCFYWS